MGKKTVPKLKAIALSVIAVILIFLFYDGEANKFKFFLCIIGMIILLALINLELWKALKNQKSNDKTKE